MAILSPTCSRFPSAFKWASVKVSTCKSFPDMSLCRSFAIFTIATVTLCLSDCFPLSFPSNKWIDSSFVSGWTDSPVPMTLIFLQTFEVRRMPMIIRSIMTTTFSIVVETRLLIFFPRWTLPCLSGVLPSAEMSRWTGHHERQSFASFFKSFRRVCCSVS